MHPASRLSLALFLVPLSLLAQQAATFTISGDWTLTVTPPAGSAQQIRVQPPIMMDVQAEAYSALPIFNPKNGGWLRGAQLKGVRVQETTSPHLLDKESFVLRSGPTANAAAFTRGVDYEIDLDWGTIGRLAGGHILPDQTVYASYRNAELRLDAVLLGPDGKVTIRTGQPKAAAPPLPAIQPGERHLGNVYLPGFISKLEPDHLFPILEKNYPETPSPKNQTITNLKKRLEAGQPLRILAWGDSVTDGSYLSDSNTQRWQEQFATRLRERYPKARIEMRTQAWGGRNTRSYLQEPAGSPHNYQETVLNLKPDLIISEFVNDAGLDPAQVEERYSKLLTDFKAIGAEWVILTPHYVRPDWMNLTRERDIDKDPRPYVAGLRQFAAKHDVALADASLRYGRLWRQGIPYNTLMLNAINHPNADGMRIFADALMALFQ
ncbi:SGNH/GDSL hydrolase family protein [Bryobacter aggregatus]|uniref:SGNH/GDSL hydrolase family protein n=1 Tax=Bryobacter aggregatus TaxID=360054 RepID=UPI0004E1A465|nr:SGNH/GDSL hydrolase family protein [Bryobacter aggregatus]